MNALKEATEQMSLYCRLRDALDWNRNFPCDISCANPKQIPVKCCTCIEIGSWLYSMEGGHYIRRSSQGQSGVQFEPRNVHAQCHHCNIDLAGNQKEYDKYMLKRYGQQVIDQLREEDKKIRERGETDLLAIALTYKDLYEELIEKNFI